MTPLREVARLAFPAIAQQLLHTLVFLVDRAMLGHHAEVSLASMQISGPFAWSVFSVLSAFTVGAIAVVGRRVGAGDRAGASAAMRAALGAALAMGCLAAAAGLLTLPAVLGLFSAATPAVTAEAAGYLSVAFPAMPLALLSYTAAVSMQAAGDTRTPFLVAASGNVLNVLVSGVLVFGMLGAPSLGARGAALGTAVALGWQAGVLLLITGRRQCVVTWRGRGDERVALRSILRVALPSLGERVLQHVGFLGFVLMIGALGARAMAANQALISVESVVFLSADGFGIAAAAMASQRLGRGDAEAAAGAIRAALGMAVVGLGACGLLFAILPEALLGLFTEDPEVVRRAVPCLYLAACAAPVLATAVVLGEALRGAGDTRAALGITFVGGLVVRLGATYLFAFTLDLGLFGVWIGSSCDWITRAVLFARAYRGGRWRTLEV